MFTKPNFWQNKNIPGWKQNGRSIITRHICIRYIVCCRSDVRWTILHNISFKSLMQVSYFLYSMICKEIVPHSAGWELFTKYALCTCYLALLTRVDPFWVFVNKLLYLGASLRRWFFVSHSIVGSPFLYCANQRTTWQLFDFLWGVLELSALWGVVYYLQCITECRWVACDVVVTVN